MKVIEFLFSSPIHATKYQRSGAMILKMRTHQHARYGCCIASVVMECAGQAG